MWPAARTSDLLIHDHSLGVPQDPGYLTLTALLGMLQRRDPLTISDSGIGTGVEEDGHDLLVAPRSVAENHRLKQSCPAEIVDMVDLDIGAHHTSHVPDVTTFACRDQRRSAKPVTNPQIWAGRQQHLNHVDAAGHAGDQPWRVMLIIQRIRIGAHVDQQPSDREPVRRCSEQERRTTSLVAGFKVRSGPQSERCSGCVATLRRGQQVSVGDLLRLLVSLQSTAEHLGDLRVPLGSGVLERTDVITLGSQPQIGAAGYQDQHSIDVTA